METNTDFKFVGYHYMEESGENVAECSIYCCQCMTEVCGKNFAYFPFFVVSLSMSCVKKILLIFHFLLSIYRGVCKNIADFFIHCCQCITEVYGESIFLFCFVVNVSLSCLKKTLMIFHFVC